MPGATVTTPPALTLHNLRKLAHRAIRRGAKLDPNIVLAIIEGKNKA